MKSIQWKAAWRHARLLNIGTLHFTFPRKVALAAIAARDCRHQTPFPLRQRLELRRKGIRHVLP
jgi:hypothetical protein